MGQPNGPLQKKTIKTFVLWDAPITNQYKIVRRYGHYTHIVYTFALTCPKTFTQGCVSVNVKNIYT
jgi:hypothetical protein